MLVDTSSDYVVELDPAEGRGPGDRSAKYVNVTDTGHVFTLEGYIDGLDSPHMLVYPLLVGAPAVDVRVYDGDGPDSSQLTTFTTNTGVSVIDISDAGPVIRFVAESQRAAAISPVVEVIDADA